MSETREGLAQWRGESLTAAVWVAAALAAVLPLLLLTTLDLRVSAGDEGVILMGAKRILSGQVPCRDFSSIVTPASFYQLAACMALLGKSLFAARVDVWTVNALTIAVLLGILAELGVPFPWKIAGVAALFGAGTALWFVVSHHWLCNLFVLASFWLVLRAMRTESPWSWAGSGALGALALLTLQDQGSYWVAGALAAIALCAPRGRRLMRCGLFAAGLLAVLLPVGLLLLAQAGWAPLWHDWVVMPLTGYRTINRDPLLTGLLDGWGIAALSWSKGQALFGAYGLLRQVQDFAVLAAVALAPLILGVAALRGKRPGSLDGKVWIISALWLSFALTMLHRPDMINLVWAFPGAIVAWLWFIARSRGGEAEAPSRAAWLVAVPFALMGLWHTAVLPLTVSSSPLSFPAGTVATLKADDFQTLQVLHRFAAHDLQPADSLYCLGYCPLYYFLLGRDNPTRFDIYAYTPEDSSRQLADLQSAAPRWILWDQSASMDLPLIAWVEKNYVRWSSGGSLSILRWKAAGPGGAGPAAG